MPEDPTRCKSVLISNKQNTFNYNISPFAPSDASKNLHLPTSDEIDEYFKQRFRGKRYIYCESGRQALSLALKSLKLRSEDLITILTTTGNFYISSCVTNEIDKNCIWSRRMSNSTSVILVNHEFGFCYEELKALKRFELPIIEDAAHSFASDNAEASAGTIGDFIVLSFPKFFPVQAGGLLVFDDRFKIDEPVSIETKRYFQKVLSFSMRNFETAKIKRRANWKYLENRFADLDLYPRLKLEPYSTPGVFLFKSKNDLDLQILKSYLWDKGIECSVFYGERAFFLPVHDRLEDCDMDYFYNSIKSYIHGRGGY